MLNKGILLGGKIKLYNIIRGSVSNVSLSYSPQTDIKAGTRVNITVNANGGYQNPWVTVSKNDGTGNVTVSGSGSSRYFTMPKSDVTITAGASVIPTYSVSGSASGGGISFSKTSGIRAGEVITVYLSPNSYYVLSSLTSSPSVGFSGSGNTRTFIMPSSNVRVTATFVANYDFMVTVGQLSGTNIGYSENKAGALSGGKTFNSPHRGVQIPYRYCYTSSYTAPNPSFNVGTSIASDGSQGTFGYNLRLNIKRLDTGAEVALRGTNGVQFMINDTMGGRTIFFTASDIGKTIPFKFTSDIYSV